MRYKYNPGFSTDTELIESFVVRQEYLQLILETVQENSTAQSNQHVLVVGARGTGKTMLVRRVAAAVRVDPELSRQWYPLVFSEESYTVTSAGEFWLEALSHLADQTQDARWHEVYDELRGEQEDRLRLRALAQLMDFADREGKRILLVVENLNMLFMEQWDEPDEWELRHTLQNEPRVMLLGTATQSFEDIENINKAWFEFFDLKKLKPLSLAECQKLWQAMSNIDITIKKIRAIHILTGGNPRLLMIMASFDSHLSFQDLMQRLTFLIDEYTDYFKSLIENLPSTERKVFSQLLELWKPSLAKEVAASARMDVNKVSACLSRLVDRGAVEVIKDGSRNQYQASERLFNIYYLMRRRSDQSNRVRALVDFMVSLYDDTELIQVTSRLTQEACSLDSINRRDHIFAYQGILDTIKDADFRLKLIKATPEEFFNIPDLPNQLRDVAKLRLSSFNDLALSSTHAQEASYENLKHYKQTKAAYKKAIELDPNDAVAWADLGLLHEKLEEYPQAKAAYEKVIALEPNNAVAWGLLGVLLHGKLEEYPQAKAAYEKVIALEPNNAGAWAQLGLLHEKLEEYSQAEAAYEKVIALKPNNAGGWELLGQLLHLLGQYEQAKTAYEKAIQLDPNDALKWAILGFLLHYKLDQYEQAKIAYEKAIQLNSNNSWAWGQLIELLIKIGQNLTTFLQQGKEILERSDRNANTLAAIAWGFYQAGKALRKPEYLLDAEILAHEAFEKEPNFWVIQDTYLNILGANGEWQDALKLAPTFIAAASTDRSAIARVTNFIIAAASAGYAQTALQLIQESPAADKLEALSVGLQVFLNQKPIVAKEIYEIGSDVAQQIREACDRSPFPISQRQDPK
jgi:tetratricopeptide (TPR) repeat protein